MPDDTSNGQPPDEEYRPRPGNRIYRVPRMVPRRITIRKVRPPKPVIGVPVLFLVYGFAGLIIAGTLLLMLPASSNSGQVTPFIDCLFTATSAVCVTGLAVVDTLDHWSFPGQFIILVLIQIGGLGFMTSATILLIAAGRRIGLRGRILVGESFGLTRIGGVVRLARNILFFTLITEMIGAIVFYFRFSNLYDYPLSIWRSIFHSICSFNNAGFEIFSGPGSLMQFNSDYLVMFTTAILIILGGISFVVINDIFRSRGLHHTTVDTKLVLLITLILLVLGTLVIFSTEYNNPQTIGNLPFPVQLANAFFASVTARSAGFSVFNPANMATYTLFFTMLLMFIGGASGSTAGGIKVNTLGIILITVWNNIRGKERPEVFNRELPLEQIFRGFTIFISFLAIIIFTFFILSILETFDPVFVLFETVSAIGIVGLSTGITPELSIAGKVLIAILMFIGRLGPLILTMTLSGAQRTSKYRYPKDSVRIG
jgi:trk system potassium uptake protein TrkH